MFRPIPAYIGLRYVVSRRSFVSFISSVAIGGLVLSVAVLVVVISVVNGFAKELENRVLGVLPHTTIIPRSVGTIDPSVLEKIRAAQGVTGASFFVQGAGLVVANQRVAGVLITGIDPEEYASTSKLHAFVSADLSALTPGDFNLFLGQHAAAKIGVQPGDSLVLVLPDAAVTPVGIFPRQKRFHVAGLVQTESELDQRAVYINISDAQRLLRLGSRVHGVQVRTDDLFAAQSYGQRIINHLGSSHYTQRSWMRTHGTLYQAIVLQKSTMFVLLSFLVAVAAFNLVSTLVMVVNERRNDIAVLRSLGCGTRALVSIFVVLGSVIGVFGILLGILIGAGMSHLLSSGYLLLTELTGLELMSQYVVQYLPVEVLLDDILDIGLVAFGLCILSTLYPAWSASKLNPSEVLRYE